MPVFKPPQATYSSLDKTKKSIFLAGSIEQGAAVNWQAELSPILENSFNVFNPRRDKWNADWEQGFESPEFYQQVDWELRHLEMADIVLFYFAPSTLSPITLLELGICAVSKPERCYVSCPEGYWRRGNVEMICERYHIQKLTDLNQMKIFARGIAKRESEKYDKNDSRGIALPRKGCEEVPDGTA